MMDARAMYPEGWHPQDPTRDIQGQWIMGLETRSRTAVGGVRYYFIDFGISTRNKNLASGQSGQETAPELLRRLKYDPYKVDVWLLGLTYRQYLTEVSSAPRRRSRGQALLIKTAFIPSRDASAPNSSSLSLST